MMNFYFHDSPEQLQELACDWNFTPGQCIRDGACVAASISAIHGVRYSFMEAGHEPLFNSVFQTFDNTQLNSDFDLEDLIGRLEKGRRLRKN